MNLGDLVQKYVKLRSRKERMEALIKEKLRPINEELLKIETAITEFLASSGQKSAKTEFGTPYLREMTSVTIEDSESLNEFISQHDAFDLYQRRINTSTYNQLLEDGVDVPGVKVSKFLKLTVKKS